MVIFKSHQVLDYITPFLPDNPIIVEAGAFNGADSVKMATHWPKGVIHSFEPVPKIFQRLQAATQPYSNIHCHPIALSDHNGTAEFYVSEKPQHPGIPSQAGSLLKPKKRLNLSPLIFPTTINVPTITLDTWAHNNAISHIDFLWLDMQGHELAVLKASPHILATVKVMYTEVSFLESYADIPQYLEVISWLESQGFVEFGRNFENTSDWFFGNIVFVRK